MVATNRIILSAAALALTGPAFGDLGVPAESSELRARLAELEAKSDRDDSRIAELETRLSAIEAPGSVDSGSGPSGGSGGSGGSMGGLGSTGSPETGVASSTDTMIPT